MQGIAKTLLPRERDVVVFDWKVLGENRLVLLIELPSARIFAHQREKSGGVHSFETLFHLLASHDTSIVLLEKDVDFAAERSEQNDGVYANPSHQEEEGRNSEQESPLHS